MAINADEDTEFNDALRAHGILPPKPVAPRTPSPPPSPTLDDLLEDYDPKEIQELASEAKDDETARFLESYRRKRLDELRQDQKRARFGDVYPISRDAYQREVTEASMQDEDGEAGEGAGTPVVCFLYNSEPASERAFSHVRTLAKRYPRTKFVSIVGDKCIENYPDRHLPTLFIYLKGRIINQQMAWGADRERSLEELEALLVLAGAIPADILKTKPTSSVSRKLGDDADEEAGSRSASTGVNVPSAKNIRSQTRVEDDDSDFDL